MFRVELKKVRKGAGILPMLLVFTFACMDRSHDVNIATSRAQIVNGDFNNGIDGWWGTENIAESMTAESGALCVSVPGGLANPWDAIVGQGNVALTAGSAYRFSFSASASDSAVMTAMVSEPEEPWGTFTSEVVTLSAEMQPFEQVFTMGETEQVPQVAFQMGGSLLDVTVCFDDVEVAPLTTEYVLNGNFESGMENWWTSGIVDGSDTTENSELCVGVPGGSVNPWSVMIGQGDVPLEAGGSYTFSFKARASVPVIIKALVGEPEGEYREFSTINAALDVESQTFSQVFQMGESDYIPQVGFQIGAGQEDWVFCMDDVSVEGSSAPPVYVPDTGPRVRVNQVGYLPFGPKVATIVTDASEPIPFSLLDVGEETVFTGETSVFGEDASSGLNIHLADFSQYTTIGDGYTLQADDETSYMFAIGEDGFEQLRYDALNFFYPMRSGVAIDESIAGEGYGRPAGHAASPSDDHVNTGDVDVPCQPAEDSALYYDEPWTCDYTLDVTGGWYDAGDSGKYVVNGGITVFQLLNLFERTKLAPSSDAGALSDGTLRIPEAGNGIPDILDEVRQELAFFLKMIVPKGDPLAGMVHHKVHGNDWTALPMLPHKDPTTRWLHRPSTAATLNLSAVAAQAARIYAPYDRRFARKLLWAARTTFNAALAHPDIYAPVADGDDGGGAYADSNVDDEFYWAAAELYLTTKEKPYLEYVLNSKLHTADVFPAFGLIWGNVAGLARMDLAMVPSRLPNRKAVIDSVLAGADGYLEDQTANGFGQPYNPPEGIYPWGSNAQVLNNLLVLGVAYDLSGKEAYRQGVLSGMDYILGRNALNMSYVTGFGTVYSENMHSRWFTHALDLSLPHPPAGTIAGGPNTEQTTWDPVANRLFVDGCAPQFCYVDDIESYATNELAINWNAVLAWVSGFIADQDESGDAPFGACVVSYNVLAKNPWTGHFVAKVKVENSGRKRHGDWNLTWSYMGDQRVYRAVGADVHQDGAAVTLSPKHLRWQRNGKKKRFIITGHEGTLADPSPGTFFLNGKACRTR